VFASWATFWLATPQATVFNRLRFANMRTLLIALLLLAFPGQLPFADAQVHEQHPYRQITLKTMVKVDSSRDKESKFRYSAWGNLTSLDRRYTQKVGLRVTLTNMSANDLNDLRVQYRVYSRDLSHNTYSVAARGELKIPQMKKGQRKIVFTDHATCQYRLRWNKLVKGNRLRRSGEKYAGYVIIYCDAKGPIRWDTSSQTVYSEYVKELREAKKLQTEASISTSEKTSPLPYSTGTTVYVTRTGRKLHKKDCRFVRTGARPISRAEALKLGYTPCSVCKP